MATQLPSPEIAGMDAFRASLSDVALYNETLDRLCAVGQHRSLSSGHELEANRQTDLLVFIAEGSAKLLAGSVNTKRDHGRMIGKAQAISRQTPHIVAYHFANDFVSILKKGDGELHMVALTKLDLVVFASSQFLDVAQVDPPIFRTVLSRSVQALHRSQTRMIEIGHKSARQRIAGFLILMAQRISGCTSGPCDFALPMSRGDIADSLGLTIETVSRQFASLSDAALIETQGRKGLRIFDIDRLKFECG